MPIAIWITKLVVSFLTLVLIEKVWTAAKTWKPSFRTLKTAK